MSDTNNSDMDQELVREFLAESLEALESLDGLFVILEKQPEDVSTVDRIFRPIHSIKGNSSFFGLLNIKNFSHSMENILQEIRSRKRVISPKLTDMLLQGVDLLRGMLEKFAEGAQDMSFTAAEQECLDKFNAELSSGGSDLADQAKTVNRMFKELQSSDISEEYKGKLKELSGIVNDLIRIVVPADPDTSEELETTYFVGDQDITDNFKTVSHFVHNVTEASNDQDACENFMEALSALRGSADKAKSEALSEHLNAMYNDFTTIQNAGIGFDDLMAGLLRERLDGALSSVKAVSADVDEPAEKMPESTPAPAVAVEEEVKEPAPAVAPTARAAEEKAAASSGSKTIRVEEEKVDSFMGFVGELIIASEVFNYLQKKLEKFPQVRDITQEFKNANISFNELSNNLQRSLMAVRRVALRSIMQKMPRLVRDLCSSTGKKVNLIIEGDNTQVDKSLLEGLENPLVHMVRNSLDHGLESPEDRIKAGKPETGTVILRANADEETFRLVIQDDGRGLDLEAIRSKAVEKGTITAEKARTMSDQETALLIFGAGVSTAKKITDISGRGVGMDVVKTNIEKLGGSITIDTVLGKGTSFTITLPMTVTLMVVDGLIARVGTESYIMPVMEVRESVRPRKDQIKTVAGKGEFIDVRGELYRLIRLEQVLGLKADYASDVETTVIIIESKNCACGVLVDDVLGQQSVVLKDLGKQFSALEFLQGAAVMGDGRIGLVMDAEGLINVSLQ